MQYTIVGKEGTPGEPISVGGVINKTINFAMQQNYVSAIRSIVLLEKAGQEWHDLLVTLEFEPLFAEKLILPVGCLKPYGKVEIKPVQIKLMTDYLMSLTEKVVGNITITVTKGEEVLTKKLSDVELLAFDQWSGSLFMPELLSAFVLPNHPEVLRIVNKAGGYLQKWGGDPSFLAYREQDPNSVKKQIAAIYAALQEENIAYALPPASFESIGQRIRLPQTIAEQKMATCLDLTVLYAGCLEAVGLHPVLVLKNEHAFLACWLEDKTFTECIQDDLSALLKRMASGIDELLTVETTCLVAGKNVDFEEAVQVGRDQLLKEKEFQFAIDVKRSRISKVRPIPVRVLSDGVYKMIDYGMRLEDEITNAPEALSTQGRGAVVSENKMTKQQLWERKLLDLSLRNTLLSFRVTQNSVQLMLKDPAILEDMLSKGETFKVYPCPTDMEFPIKEGAIYDVEQLQKVSDSLIESEFSNKRIRTFLEDAQLEQSMKKLHRSAKNSLEENGSNNLYLALGFLKWYENDDSKKERFAPLILVPVDMIRKIQEKSYQIKIRDEEAQINITLLEMLRQDFQMDIGGLDPLPLDENGIDIPLILNTIRQGVMEKKRWDVLPLSFLGIFSFSRFIMWNDIRNRQEDILSNKLVSSLISGKMEWTTEEGILTAKDLDEVVNPCDMAVPLSADSSQMVAICAAAKGQSFVLHGPPGTGKSQTITNMICNALYQGKSVLFVAEKMAALTVVQKRLEKIGLAPFCLELHSNKAQKRAVLGQLEKTLETGKLMAPEEFAAKAEKINELRGKLNEVVKEIHKKRECGFSLYELLSMYEGLNIYQGKMAPSEELLAKINQSSWEHMIDLLNDYKAAAAECGKNNPLEVFAIKEYTMDLRERLAVGLKKYAEELTKVLECTNQLKSFYHISEDDSAKLLNFLDSVSGQADKVTFFSAGLLQSNQLKEQEENYRSIILAGVKRQGTRKELLAQFKDGVLEYDVVSAQNRWAQATAKWVLARNSEQKALRKELAFFALNPDAVKEENILSTYELLAQYQVNNSVITAEEEFLKTCFEGYYRQDETDYAKIGQIFEENLVFRKIIDGCEVADSVKTAVIDVLISQNHQEAEQATRKEVTKSYCEARAAELKSENNLMQTYAFDWNRVSAKVPYLSSLSETVKRCGENLDGLRARAAYVKAAEELKKELLSEIAEGFENGKLNADDFVNAFKCNTARALSLRTIQESDVLKQFTGTGFEEMILRYKDVLNEFEILTIREVAARLSAKLPKLSLDLAQSSELGILQRAIKSGGRAMSIRKLFDTIPTLIRKMCPCMLMSPISVAQYIAPSFPKFDLVIFDEASQLPTSEAVGTLARGENAIVVGDPKQLPPTSFFISGKTNEEESEIEDMESLLDDCLTLSMPQEHLRWHYRSRHESLIAYSNMTYYDNKLYTFPSPNDLISQVKLIPVEGTYDRGKTKQNRAEAEAIIAEIVRRLQDEKLRKDSIGVVTFSSVQQELIEDLLVEAFRANPELEQINNTSYEPIFIKNLENVQGDERDVILFSVCYGPDATGKVSLNFGPLNQSGGWRRLNVAISRSRKEMQIYSTLRADQISLDKTVAEGVVELKGFLEFAEGGRNMVPVRSSLIKKTNTDLVESIAEEISLLGYEVKTNIGSSEYKVDIGVVNPEHPETYCIGILCDGENYSMADTAKDRNVLQPNVLKALGWKLHRIWILDWLDSPKRELEKMKAAIEASLKNEEEAVIETSEEPIVFVQDVEESDNSAKQIYQICKLPHLGDADDFYQPKSKIQIAKCVEKILEAEAPINKRLLERRVMSAWGMGRAGARAEDAIDEVVRALPIQRTQTHGSTYYWLENMNPLEYSTYRVSPEGEEDCRTFDEICAEEIAVAVKEILKEQISLSREDVVRETAKRFGYTRVGAVIDTLVGIGISYAEQRHFVVVSEDGQKVTCLDN